MKIFLVTVWSNREVEILAKLLINELGMENYASAEEFFPDGVQDPYRAIDEVDALVWIYTAPDSFGKVAIGMCDYNYFYADTVMQRAVRTGKPILYYYIRCTDTVIPSPALLRRVTRRNTVSSLQDLENKLREDLHDLQSRRIPLSNPDSPSIFLSYAHKDKHFVRRLAKDLKLAGARVWVDEGEIQIGESLIETIRCGIDECDYFGVILSPNSINSKWVRQELDVAMNLDIDGKRLKILPLMYKKCELPGFLAGKLYADFSKDYVIGLALVIKRLGLHELTTLSG